MLKLRVLLNSNFRNFYSNKELLNLLIFLLKMGLCCFKTAAVIGCRNIALQGVAY